jgi:hypothetical protein
MHECDPLMVRSEHADDEPPHVCAMVTLEPWDGEYIEYTRLRVRDSRKINYPSRVSWLQIHSSRSRCYGAIRHTQIALHRKKIPETDAIFAQLKQINAAADAAPDSLRVSIDAKATVKVGPFARGGKSRTSTSACTHPITASTIRSNAAGAFLSTTGTARFLTRLMPC